MIILRTRFVTFPLIKKLYFLNQFSDERAAAIKTKGHWPLANDFLEGDGGDAEARFGEGQRGVVMAFCRGLMLHPWR